MTECGLTNLATCMWEKFFQYLSGMFNSAVEPLLNITYSLLTEPVNIALFQSLWAVIIYVISLFYGLFLIFAGFNLMISGYDSAKREKAKYWLRNVFLMIIFVQASFLIYNLIIELGSLLTAGVMNLIDPQFFLPVADNLTNFVLQLLMQSLYIPVLLLTIILLGIRYFLVAVGVVLFPLAIFFYFIPPLQSIGKLILNVLMAIIFITFFDAILLFGASALLSIPVFASIKMMLSAIAFLTVNLFMVLILAFAVIKAVFSVKNSTLGGGFRSGYRYISSRPASVPVDKSQTKLSDY